MEILADSLRCGRSSGRLWVETLSGRHRWQFSRRCGRSSGRLWVETPDVLAGLPASPSCGRSSGGLWVEPPTPPTTRPRWRVAAGLRAGCGLKHAPRRAHEILTVLQPVFGPAV